MFNAYIHSDDVNLIKGLAISRSRWPEFYYWAFTDTRKYTFKSGYKIELQFPDKVFQAETLEPDINLLLSYTWRLKYPPKLKYFIWQVIKGVILVAKNLWSRGIDCEQRCSLCGAEEESTNHVLFECPPALQIWTLSEIPSAPGIFQAPRSF